MQNVSIALETFGAAIREIQIRTQFIMKVIATINSSVSISHILKMNRVSSDQRKPEVDATHYAACGCLKEKRQRLLAVIKRMFSGRAPKFLSCAIHTTQPISTRRQQQTGENSSNATKNV